MQEIETSACGCQWRRDDQFGEVIAQLCPEHTLPKAGTCSCRRELDPELEAEVALEQCPAHAAESDKLERGLRRVLGYELDVLVTAACAGKRLAPRLQPKDPFR